MQLNKVAPRRLRQGTTFKMQTLRFVSLYQLLYKKRATNDFIAANFFQQMLLKIFFRPQIS